MSGALFFLDLSPIGGLLPALAAHGQRDTNYALLREIVRRIPTLPRLDANATPVETFGIAVGAEAEDRTLSVNWNWPRTGAETVGLVATWVEGQLTSATLQVGDEFWALLYEDNQEARLEPEEIVGPRQARDLERVQAKLEDGLAAVEAQMHAEHCPNCGRDYAEASGICPMCGPATALVDDGYFEQVVQSMSGPAETATFTETAELTLLPEFNARFAQAAALVIGRLKKPRAKTSKSSKDNSTTPKQQKPRKRKKPPG